MTWSLRRLFGLSFIVTFALFAATTTRPAETSVAGSPGSPRSEVAPLDADAPPEGLSDHAWGKILRQVRTSQYDVGRSDTAPDESTTWQARNRGLGREFAFGEQSVTVEPSRAGGWWWGFETETALPTWMELRQGAEGMPRLALLVDAQDARYPVVVDLLITTQVARRTASDAAANDDFGSSASVSGDTVRVGDRFGASTYTDTVCEWNQIARPAVFDPAPAGDNLGWSVSVSGDTVVVGVPADNDAGSNPGSGSAHVFERNVGGADAWGHVAKLTASDAAALDLFGNSVSVSDDTVVVGASRDDDAGSDSGSAYVYERNVGGADAWGQVAKLTASDAAVGDFFGVSVSVSGDTIVVGAYNDDDAGFDSGSAYVFERNEPSGGGADAWGQVAKLAASDAAADDEFGIAVSVSGDTIVVGAAFDDDAGFNSGSAYVFGRNVGGADTWGQAARLTASDAAFVDFFGRSVSVSGDSVVVGAPGNDDAGLGSGSAYVFERNVGGADAWGQVAKLTASDATAGDDFGRSVSASGDTVVVGARGGDDAGSDSGSAYVFVDIVGGAEVWEQVAKLTDSDAAAGDLFGTAVSVGGDTVVVGAPGNDDAGTSSGAAFILREAGCTTCGDAAREGPEECDDGPANSDAIPDACRTDCTLPGCGDDVIDSGETCDDGASNSDTAPDACRTGCALAACSDGITDTGEECDDGNTDDGDGCSATCQDECGDGIVNNDDSEQCDDGAANSDGIPDACRTDCTFPRCGDDVTDTGEECDDGAGNSDTTRNACRTDCTLPACGDGVTDTGEECDDGNTDDGDGCGATCRNECGDGIVNNGDEECDDGNTDDGDGCNARCQSEFCGDGILNNGGTEQCDDGNTDDGDGCNATCRNEFCGDGIVNGFCEWSEIAKPVASDAAEEDYFGSSVSVSGDTVVVGAASDDDAGRDSGSAYVFERNVGGADAWDQVAKLTAPDADAADYFGHSVSVSGDTIVVGAYRDDDPEFGSGSAYVFERNVGRAWSHAAKLTASDAVDRDAFGWSVSVSGNTVAIGARSGSVYVFERNVGGADAWGQVAKLTGSDTAAADIFGDSVSVSGDTVVVGASRASRSGSAYVFERNVGGADAWGQVAKLTASDPAADDEFGYSVSVSGNTVVVGARGGDDAGSASGSAYVFERNVGGADAWGQVAKRTASDAAAGDLFGVSVSVSDDTVVVGANGDDDAELNSGSVYVFERNVGGSDAWGQSAKLTASDAGLADWFGISLSVSGDTVVVGAFTDTGAGFDSGSAYILTPRCEECDDGTANSDTIPDACRTDCTLPGCGDDVTDTGEECDDGNTEDGDGCNATCRNECGDGIVDTGAAEQCDDGNTTDGDGCNATCQNEFCGDGVVNNSGTEQCDDGNTDDGDGCNANCQVETCGDGIVNNNDTEQCDDGNTTDGDGCNATCQNEFCGDGVVNNNGIEQCDDGNNLGNDGCAADCSSVCIDVDGDGYGQPPDPVACPSAEGDCDDNAPNVNPGQLEDCDNGIDDDCDGLIDADDRVDCVPLAARLDAIWATSNADGTVTVGWRTVLEVDMFGFRVLRARDKRKEGELETLTLQPIPPRGSAFAGAEYTYTDTDPIPGRSYYYIEGIDHQGQVQRFGPVSVEVPSGRTRPARNRFQGDSGKGL